MNTRKATKVVELPPPPVSWLMFWLYVLIAGACFTPIAVLFVLARRWL